MASAEEAAAAWLDAALDAGIPVPGPSTLDQVRADPSYEGWLYGFVDIDPDLLDDTTERVNITLPRRVLARIDAKAKERGESRSRFIARMALD